MPDIGFRGINESCTEFKGVVNPQVEPLFIGGSRSKVDRVLVKTQGASNNNRAIHDSMKAKALAIEYTKKFFNCDNATDPNEFDGLKSHLTGNHVFRPMAMTC